MRKHNWLKKNILFVFALAVMGTVLVACDGMWFDSWDDDNDANYREEFHKTFPLGPGGRFSLKNTNGDIHVSTWDKNEAEINAVKIARRSESDLGRVTIEAQGREGEVTVDTIYPKLSNVRVSVEYEVRLPAGVNLDVVRSTNGDVVLNGKFASARASSTNGDIKLEGASAETDLSTTNGSINASDLEGRVNADTTNGRITLGIVRMGDDIKADTTNGSITVRLTGEVNARLHAHTTNGHINTSIPVTIQGSQSRRRLEGTIGSGGPLLSLSTTNGSITIER